MSEYNRNVGSMGTCEGKVKLNILNLHCKGYSSLLNQEMKLRLAVYRVRFAHVINATFVYLAEHFPGLSGLSDTILA